jgi:hypothetical protein
LRKETDDQQQHQKEPTTGTLFQPSTNSPADTLIMPSSDSFRMVALDQLTPVGTERKVISKSSPLARAKTTSSLKSNTELPMYWSAYCNVDKKDWSRIEHIGGSTDGVIWPSQNADQMFQCIRGAKKKEE